MPNSALWLVGWGLPIAISVIIATGVTVGELNHPLVKSHQEQIEQFKQSIKQEVMQSIEQAEIQSIAKHYQKAQQAMLEEPSKAHAQTLTRWKDWMSIHAEVLASLANHEH